MRVQQPDEPDHAGWEDTREFPTFARDHLDGTGIRAHPGDAEPDGDRLDHARAGGVVPAVFTGSSTTVGSSPCRRARHSYGNRPQPSRSALYLDRHLRMAAGRLAESNPSGVTIRIYALTACLHSATASKPNASCVDAGDTIPKADLLILGTAPASAGSYSFVLEEPIGEGLFGFGLLPGDGPIVQAILLQAVGPGGGSAFAIVATTGGCYGCIL